jgi:hypothetical protein
MSIRRRNVIHLLLTHVGEENITQAATGRWACWGHDCPSKTGKLLDHLVSEALVAVNSDGRAFLTFPHGLDMLIELNDEAGIPQ